MTTALITGATSGIGRAFAERLAADGVQLVLVARDRARLAELAGALPAPAGPAGHESLPADLATTDGRTRVEERLRDADRPVDMLVNNAGIGAAGGFADSDLEVLTTQFDLAVTTVFRLTRAAVEGMIARGHGSVVNVASFGALLPGSNATAYTAAKSYVATLTAQLAAELRGTGVRALALFPGWTRTELHARSGAPSPDDGSGWWLDPAEVVDTALRDLARGRNRSVPGRRYKLLLALTDALPRAATSR